MKRLKIRIKSPEHSKMVQEKLLEMGYEWARNGNPAIRYVDEPYLFTSTYFTNKITYANSSADDYYFESQPHTEVELVEVISYEFKEVKKRNVVKVGENSYYEDELLEALKQNGQFKLKNIKPINGHDN